MTRNTIRLLLIIVLLLAPEWMHAQSTGPERFSNATAGFSLVRPAGWQTASLQQVQANREGIRLTDPELQAAIQSATAPLFVFTKYQEPFPGLNPSVQVMLRPTGAMATSSPVQIMTVAVTALQGAYADFAFVTPIEETSVSGLAAARMKAKYTLKTTGGEFKVLTRLWVVPRGSFVFLISMGGTQDGPDVSESEFSEVLASIQIQR